MRINVDGPNNHPGFIYKCNNIKWYVDCDFPHHENILHEFILSNSWPVAVNPNDIIRSEADLQFRAKRIYHSVLKDLGGKSLVTIGYDPSIAHYNLSNYEICHNISFWQLLAQPLPKYDLILVYDELDHMLADQRDEAVSQMVKLMHSDTKLFIRFHPWTSIHGGHCYNRLNKAYAHLFLGPRVSLYQDHEVDQIAVPIVYYDKLLSRHGLEIIDANIYKNDIPPIINQEDMFAHISKNFNIPAFLVPKIISITYMDYTLKLPNHSSSLL